MTLFSHCLPYKIFNCTCHAKLGVLGLHLLGKVVFYGIVVLKFGGVPPEKVGIKYGWKGFVLTLIEFPHGITKFLNDIMLALLIEEGFGGEIEFFRLIFGIEVWNSSFDDSIDDLAEEFDAHNIDFEDGLEDVEEVVDFGVVTECFFVVGLDQDTI